MLIGGCGGAGDDVSPGPLVGRIDDAIVEVEAFYGAPQNYFEISATPEVVSVIVATDDASRAEQAYLTSDGFDAPRPVGPAEGATFTADQIDFDPGSIFDRIRTELDDPNIGDFAIQGGPDGTVIYDASVISDVGGTLRVLLGGEGEILGVRPDG